MPTASVQYDDDEKLAMARAAATLLARWSVPHETAGRLLHGDYPTEQAAALLGIHAALRRIFSDNERAARWIGAANDAFDGRSALDVMLADGLASIRRVRRYLESELTG